MEATQLRTGNRSYFSFSFTTFPALAILVYYVGYFILVPITSRQSAASSLIDESGAILLFPLAVLGFLRSLRNRQSLTFWALGYFVIMSVSSVVAMAIGPHGAIYPPLAPILGIILDLKPFVYLYFFYEVLSRKNCNIDAALRAVMWTLVVLALFNGVFAVRDFVVGGSSIWGIPLMSGPMGSRVPMGLFNFKYGCACLTMCGALACLGLMRQKVTPPRVAILLFLLALLVVIASAKELTGGLMGAAVYVFGPSPRRTAAQAVHRMFFAMAIVIIASVSFGVLSAIASKRYRDYALESTVRVTLYTSSVSIAADRFPFGSGAGTFATWPSRSLYYSPLYYQYGLYFMYGGTERNSSFLMDVWWPHVLAESGMFGFAFYMAFVMSVLKGTFTAARRRPDGFSLSLFMLASAIVINSVAASTFTSEPLLPVIGLVFGASMLPVRPRTAGSIESDKLGELVA